MHFSIAWVLNPRLLNFDESPPVIPSAARDLFNPFNPLNHFN